MGSNSFYSTINSQNLTKCFCLIWEIFILLCKKNQFGIEQQQQHTESTFYVYKVSPIKSKKKLLTVDKRKKNALLFLKFCHENSRTILKT